MITLFKVDPNIVQIEVLVVILLLVALIGILGRR